MTPQSPRKFKSADDQDPFIAAAVAKLFWQGRKVDKVRIWSNQAVALVPNIGDFWAQLYKFEVQRSDEDMQTVCNGAMRCCQAPTW